MNIMGVEINAKEAATLALFGAGVVWGFKNLVLEPAAGAVVKVAEVAAEETKEFVLETNPIAQAAHSLADTFFDWIVGPIPEQDVLAFPELSDKSTQNGASGTW